MSGFALGLDIGGGGGRCLLLDLETGRRFSAARPWRFQAAPETGGLGFDLDLDAIWHGLCGATHEALAAAGAGPEDVRAAATTSLRLGNVFVGKGEGGGKGEGESKGEGDDVLFAVPNRDARAAGPGLLLGLHHGEELHRRTGRWPYPIFTAARLQWMRDQHPDRFARIHRVLAISDWLFASEPTQAGESLLFDLHEPGWADDLIEKLELPRALFPEIRHAGQPLGELRAEAAEALGLAAGIPVAMGVADTQAGLLGAGAVSPGDLTIVAGTTGPIQLVLAEPVIDPEARVWSGHHAIPGHWVLESNCGPLGETLDWFSRVLFPGAPNATLRLLAEAAQSEPASQGLLSTLGAEVMNARAMGLPVANLTLTHLSSMDDERPRRHLLRSILEGMACALRANIEQLEEVAKGAGGSTTTGPLRLTGGLSRSALFAEIIAGVTGRAVEVSDEAGATGLGAALCAAVGAGASADLSAAVERYVAPGRRVDPKADEAEVYADVYRRWSELRAARSEADTLAANFAIPFALRSNAVTPSAASADDRPRILVTADFDEAALDALREVADVEYASFREQHRMLKDDALVEALSGYAVGVVEIDLVDAASIERLPELRVVASCRGDAVNVDIAACTAFGIPVLNAPGRNADAVADLAIAFCLMLARKLTGATAFMHAPGVEPGDLATMGKGFVTFQGRELWRKTVGLVGLGAVGRKVAERLSGFGIRLLVADPFVSAEQAALVGGELVTLETLLAESDFVSLHAAVTDATEGMISAEQFAHMKSDAVLVNTARAALLDESALFDAVKSGAIAGAALDTFSVEPPGSDHPLLSLDNVISTPHMGGNTTDVAAHQGEIIVADLRRLLAGEAPRFALNPATLDDFSWTDPRPQPSAEVMAQLKEGPAPVVTDLHQKKKKN